MGKLVVIDSAFQAEKARRFGTMLATITSLSDECNQLRGERDAGFYSTSTISSSARPTIISIQNRISMPFLSR